LNNEKIKAAIERHLTKKHLIIGICNGFQALIKSGLLPGGKLGDLSENSPTLYRNDINRHISHIAQTVVTSNNSPWLSSFKPGEIHKVALSHGEGKLVVSDQQAQEWFDKGQVAFQYCNDLGEPTMDTPFNPNGSHFAIEGIVSPCGLILGKMGHSERAGKDIFKNIEGNHNQPIFKNGVNYFLEK
jgi:phosphoribosylformylglycinamidine synthase